MWIKTNKKILLFIGFLCVVLFVFKIPSTNAIIRDQTISTVAEKDSYVNSDDLTSNYGGKDWLIFGNYILGWNEAYLHFNFSDKPASWTKAEISIDMYSISETFNVTVSLINDTWSEYTIDWVNKPDHREVITTFTVAAEKIYKIDITDYIEGRNSISICLNASNYLQNGYVQGSSKEGAYSSEDYPQLIWTYPETAEITVTSPTSSNQWQNFNYYTIKWTSQGSIEKVIIQLYKGSTLVKDITYTYTDNNGEFEFYVSSSDNYKGTDYRIKITDYDDSRVYNYSDYFLINEIPETPDVEEIRKWVTIPGYHLIVLISVIMWISLILIKRIEVLPLFSIKVDNNIFNLFIDAFIFKDKSKL